LLLPALLVFLQPDLGSSLVLVFSWLGIVFASGVSWVYLGFLLVPLAGSLPLVWHFLKDYQRQRLLSFLSPSGDPLGAGYHLVQSMVAVGAGRFLGRGFGQGTQSHLRFLPEGQTDFIFASFAEEMGFLGSLILVFCFLLLLWRVLVVALEARNRFGYLVCLGAFSLLFFQTVVNMGMNLGLLPITGVTLPLVSYGGSSLLATFIFLGLVESVARFGRKREVVEIK
jgi:rod shape determining protein RodA